MGDLQPCQPEKVIFQNDRMYSHSTLRINYTSYDVRRQQDFINPNSPSGCRYVLLRSDTGDNLTEHLFLYARVLGIYHANIRLFGRPPKRIDFLWVRWLDYNEEEPGSWDAGRLDRVCYPKCRSDSELLDGFGFVDPQHIVRACHLIPDFDSGLVESPVPSTCDGEDGDWKYHYVNR